MLKRLAAGFAALLIAASVSGATVQAQSRDGRDRRVIIVNNTEHDMVEFHASNVRTDSWQEDILGDEVLESGHQVVVRIDDGTGYCMYDFKAVFDNGQVLIRHNVNVCQIVRYTYNE